MRLYIFPSLDKTKAVIIFEKKKSAGLYQQILWNIENDTFEEGQWLTKRSFANDDCSLFAHQFQANI